MTKYIYLYVKKQKVGKTQKAKMHRKYIFNFKLILLDHNFFFNTLINIKIILKKLLIAANFYSFIGMRIYVTYYLFKMVNNIKNEQTIKIRVQT